MSSDWGGVNRTMFLSNTACDTKIYYADVNNIQKDLRYTQL